MRFVWFRLFALVLGSMLAIIALTLVFSGLIPSRGELIAVGINPHTALNNLYWLDLRTERQVGVTPPTLNVISPQWSPDGQRLVFVANVDALAQIYVMDFPNGRPERLFNSTSNDFNPRWSPDGRWIVFESTRASVGSLYLYDLTTGEQHRIDHGAGAYAREPRWSPDSQQIVFYADDLHDTELFVYTLTTNDTERLTFNDWNEWQPSWSPDNRWIVYFANADANDDLYAIDIETRSETRLTFHLSVDRYPSWSTNGRWIAFISNRNGSSEELMLLDAACMTLDLDCDSFVHPLGIDRVFDDLTWAPDGSALVFSRPLFFGSERYLVELACLSAHTCTKPPIDPLPSLDSSSTADSWRPSAP